jgi:hypothetical protein
MKEQPISRQAERQALHGGYAHQVTRGDWGRVAEPPPLLDEESVRYPKKKKRRDRKPKERCNANPNGHAHEWMKDTEEVPILKTHRIREKYSPAMAEFLGRDYWTRYKAEQVGTTEVLYRLCVHCGKVQYKNGSRRWDESGSWLS